MKKLPIIDLSNYQKQNNIAIDMCAACIIHNRKFGLPLKAIILSKAYFDILKKWAFDNYGEEFAESEWSLEGVEIRKETIWTGKTMLQEYFKNENVN